MAGIANALQSGRPNAQHRYWHNPIPDDCGVKYKLTNQVIFQQTAPEPDKQKCTVYHLSLIHI